MRTAISILAAAAADTLAVVMMAATSAAYAADVSATTMYVTDELGTQVVTGDGCAGPLPAPRASVVRRLGALLEPSWSPLGGGPKACAGRRSVKIFSQNSPKRASETTQARASVVEEPA